MMNLQCCREITKVCPAQHTRNVCGSMCYFLIDHSLKTHIDSFERHIHTLIDTMYKMDKTEISSGQIWHMNIRLYTENILRSPHCCAIIYRGI